METLIDVGLRSRIGLASHGLLLARGARLDLRGSRVKDVREQPYAKRRTMRRGRSHEPLAPAEKGVLRRLRVGGGHPRPVHGRTRRRNRLGGARQVPNRHARGERSGDEAPDENELELHGHDSHGGERARPDVAWMQHREQGEEPHPPSAVRLLAELRPQARQRPSQARARRLHGHTRASRHLPRREILEEPKHDGRAVGLRQREDRVHDPLARPLGRLRAGLRPSDRALPPGAPALRPGHLTRRVVQHARKPRSQAAPRPRRMPDRREPRLLDQIVHAVLVEDEVAGESA